MSKNAFAAAASMSTAAAFMIAQPWAFYVAIAIGTLVSNPDGMADSAKNWRTRDEDGVTEELDQLLRELNLLKERLEKEATWEGGAFQSFEQVHSNFVASIGDLKEIRNETGSSVSSTAEFLKIVSWVVFGIAAVMFAWGVFCFATRWHPVAAVTVYGLSAALGKAILAALRKILANNVRAMGILALVMTGVVTYTQTTARMFPTLDPVPRDTSMKGDPTDPSSMKMPFMNVGMEYDERSGTLTPAEGESPTKPDGSTESEGSSQ